MRLNVACGPNIFPFSGWTNYDKADFSTYFAHLRTAPLDGMPEHQQRVARFVREHHAAGMSPAVIPWRCGESLPHGDSTVDLVYVGQFIEHLNRRTQAVPFLRECRRVLMPGGVLRMTTPDMEKIHYAYQNGLMHRFDADQPAWFGEADDNDKLSYLLFGASGPDCTQEHYEGHFHCYSEATTRAVLEEAGFQRIVFSQPPRPEIRDEGMSHSLCVEAVK